MSVEATGARQPLELSDLHAEILRQLPAIATLCSHSLARRQDAEDAAQQAVAEILRGWSGYRGEAPLPHWMLKIAWRTALRMRATLPRTARPEDTMTADSPAPDADSEEREQREQLRRAVADLPEGLQGPVTLYYFHRMTQADIAALLQVSQKTISERINKGLASLNKALSASMAGLAPATLLLQGAGLEAAPSSLASAVGHMLAGHAAASTAATAGIVSAGAVSPSLLLGGMFMNAKWIAAAVLAVAAALWGASAMQGRGNLSLQAPDTLSSESNADTQALRESLAVAERERATAETEADSLRNSLRETQDALKETQSKLAHAESQAALLAAAANVKEDDRQTDLLPSHTKTVNGVTLLEFMKAMQPTLHTTNFSKSTSLAKLIGEELSLTDDQVFGLADILTAKSDGLLDILIADEQLQEFMKTGVAPHNLEAHLAELKAEAENEYERNLANTFSADLVASMKTVMEKVKTESREAAVQSSLAGYDYLQLSDYQSYAMEDFLRRNYREDEEELLGGFAKSFAKGLRTFPELLREEMSTSHASMMTFAEGVLTPEQIEKLKKEQENEARMNEVMINSMMIGIGMKMNSPDQK